MCGIYAVRSARPSTRTIVPMPTGESSAVQKWNSCGVFGRRSVATTRPSAVRRVPGGAVTTEDAKAEVSRRASRGANGWASYPRPQPAGLLPQAPGILRSRECRTPSCPTASRAATAASARRESSARSRFARSVDRLLRVRCRSGIAVSTRSRPHIGSWPAASRMRRYQLATGVR